VVVRRKRGWRQSIDAGLTCAEPVAARSATSAAAP
jgi:hypothetical protein